MTRQLTTHIWPYPPWQSRPRRWAQQRKLQMSTTIAIDFTAFKKYNEKKPDVTFKPWTTYEKKRRVIRYEYRGINSQDRTIISR